MARAIIVSFAAALAAAAASNGQQGGGGEAPPAKVRMERIVVREVAPTSLVPGTVASRHDARVAAETAGRIVYVAEPGDRVATDDPIARIDDAAAGLAVAAAEARRRRAEVALARLNLEADRWASLAEQGNAPESRLEEVRSERDMAAQDLAEARVAEDRARVDLARTVVRAPYDGLVAERLIEVGEYSTPGREIARVVDTVALEARAQAPISTAGYVDAGRTITISDERGGARVAPVRAIIPAGDPLTRTFELRADLEGSDWLIGSPVRVAVPTAAPRRALTAPRDAVVLRSDALFVMKVDAENVAHRVDVEIGSGGDVWIEVTGEGLADGDRVVVRGAERLRDGQRVEELVETAGGVSGAEFFLARENG